MIDFEQENRVLELHYSMDSGDSSWVDERLEEDNSVRIYRTFAFTAQDLIRTPEHDDFDARIFALGIREGEYYRIKARILGLKHDLYLKVGMTINEKNFLARRISIFRKIDVLIDEEIIIGGKRENAIPLEDFRLLLKNFPTNTELNHYAGARIARILRDYFDTLTDAQKKLENYLGRKEPITASSPTSVFKEYEIEKWIYIRDQIKAMLASTDSYSEKQWQTLMLDFILLLFPKYVKVLENVQIKDFYTASGKTKNRYIDLMLVDADGHVDVIEIKKPFLKALLSTSQYRENYTPRKELSGSIMQVEKYIFHLNKWGVAGEKTLNTKYAPVLPPGLTMKVVNPKALVILGRDNNFSKQERFDFEIIRRKYANLIDILTYDDLLRRLDNIITQLEAV